MLISPSKLRRWFGVNPTGVLHVGAHHAEEFRDYREARFGPTIWVEAQSDLISYIENVISGSEDSVIQAVAWSETGRELTLKVTSETQSSSLYGLADHLVEYPQIQMLEERKVKTVRLDQAVPAGFFFDFLTLDIQGAELEALRGLGERMSKVQWIFTEVNQREMYEAIPLVDELDHFLAAEGFQRVVTIWNSAGWGDALYARTTQRTTERIRFATASLVVRADFHGRELQQRLRKKVQKLRRRIYRTIDSLRGLGTAK